MSDEDLVVPFSLRAWMDHVEEFCNRVEAYLTEVETRLKGLESGQACDCHPDVPHRLVSLFYELPGVGQE